MGTIALDTVTERSLRDSPNESITIVFKKTYVKFWYFVKEKEFAAQVMGQIFRRDSLSALKLDVRMALEKMPDQW
jgi:hypothetical protein